MTQENLIKNVENHIKSHKIITSETVEDKFNAKLNENSLIALNDTKVYSVKRHPKNKNQYIIHNYYADCDLLFHVMEKSWFN